MAKYDEQEILRGLEIISKIKPSSEATRRAMERVRETLADKQTERGRLNSRIWLNVVQSRIIKLAAAAVIIIAVIIGISQFGGTAAEAGVCWAEVGKKVEQIEMFVYSQSEGNRLLQRFEDTQGLAGSNARNKSLFWMETNGYC